MRKALYRKYRPLTFDDVIGQESVTKILSSQVSNKSFSHAYLFTGSRGTGKTSSAKIFSRAINCLNPSNGNPCNECEVCKGILEGSITDVMEVDAASHNGVNDAREIISNIEFAPIKAKYKVFIIDEAHMLTPSAFNSLLKTIEEPPEHAVFILATTEIDKILPTILSRCQRYDFKRIDNKYIVDRIKYISEIEGFKINEEASKLIANISDGGMRDALSILDMCLARYNEIDESIVNNICGIAPVDNLLYIIECVKNGLVSEFLTKIAQLHDNSIDMQFLCKQLCEAYRNIILIQSGLDVNMVVKSTSDINSKYESVAKSMDAVYAIKCLEALSDCLSRMNNSNRRSLLEIILIKISGNSFESSNPEKVKVSNISTKAVLGNNISNDKSDEEDPLLLLKNKLNI